jgi:hypothetical protein
MKYSSVVEARLQLYFPRIVFLRLVMTPVIVLGTNLSAFVMELHCVYCEVGNYILINFRPQAG